MAPEIFSRVGEMSAVSKQPSCQEERVKALQALLSCPTSSIVTEKPARDILEVQKTFPIPIDTDRIPSSVNVSTSNVEMKLNGCGPWSLSDDDQLIHTPGHTEGSVCLFYKPLKVLFTGDHLAMDESKLAISQIYNFYSVPIQLDSVAMLLELEFEWILPGHGRRVAFKDVDEKNASLKAFLTAKQHTHVY
ncbi:hypothetical protein M8C21_030394 [Ambrosia artemisiifolia]|uniref:Metallo-beta-lactamase domain-containing protein n=1 Tax=Ambrosia artemisiifolia TaxID=4212 RepID=A0AAD5CBS9_AMBAR|nr:hypothetical protein M8C21_030394 [Ambrosia artemisiifolia]